MGDERNPIDQREASEDFDDRPEHEAAKDIGMGLLEEDEIDQDEDGDDDEDGNEDDEEEGEDDGKIIP